MLHNLHRKNAMSIQFGSTGNNVKCLQTRLGLNTDGVFGNATEDAVKVWQKANGLTDDGVVGIATWSKLFPNVDTATHHVVDKYTSGSLKVTLDNFFLNVIPESIRNQLVDICIKYEINTPLRLAHFL